MVPQTGATIAGIKTPSFTAGSLMFCGVAVAVTRAMVEVVSEGVLEVPMIDVVKDSDVAGNEEVRCNFEDDTDGVADMVGGEEAETDWEDDKLEDGLEVASGIESAAGAVAAS